MIDVLHVIDTARIGGPGKTIINSARLIDRSQFRVHVASFTSPEKSRNEFAAAVVAAGIPFFPLPETRRVEPRHLGLLRQYIRTSGISIVHAHGYRSDVLTWLATRRTPAAIVTTHHGWIRNNWRQKAFTRGARLLSGRFDGVQVVSGHLLDELPARARRSGIATIVHNAIVLDDYGPLGRRGEQRRQLSIRDEEVLVAVVGRLSIEKGCLEMIDAFALLVERHPRARLVFIGEGPLETSLRKSVAARDLAARVLFVPHQNDVRPMYEAMDILVCPSRTEGLSNVIMEAMAYSRPVVATRVGGNVELVQDGVTGVLVPARDPARLADGLSGMLGGQSPRAELGRAGRARVAAAFSFDGRMRREEAFYRDVLRRAGQLSL